MNLARFSDRLGDWNPQLLRELRGISRTSVAVILGGSLLLQAIGYLWLVSGSSSEQRIAAGFNCLTYLLPLATILGGIYTLIDDLNRERNRGTLNFVRLSPQSGRTILVGKLIGVPSLVYLTALSIVPLHLGLGILNGANLITLLAWYLTVGVTIYFWLSWAILYALHGGKYKIIIALVATQISGTGISIYNYYLNSTIGTDNSIATELPEIIWFYLPIFGSAWQFYLFSCLNILAICHWLWITIDRKYTTLTATSLTKSDSYWVNLQVQLWLLGFGLPLATAASKDEYFYPLSLIYPVGLIFTALLLAAILPNRRSIQAWSQEWQLKYGDRNQFNWRDSELIRSLLWDDRAPAILTTIVNLAVTAVIWELTAIGLLLFTPNLKLFGQFSLGIAIGSIIVLLYALNTHLLHLQSRFKKSTVIPNLITMSIVPCLCGLFVGLGADIDPSARVVAGICLLFSPLFGIAIAQLSLPVIAGTAIFQIWTIFKLNQIVDRQLITIGLTKIETTTNKFMLEQGNI